MTRAFSLPVLPLLAWFLFLSTACAPDPETIDNWRENHANKHSSSTCEGHLYTLKSNLENFSNFKGLRCWNENYDKLSLGLRRFTSYDNGETLFDDNPAPNQICVAAEAEERRLEVQMNDGRRPVLSLARHYPGGKCYFINDFFRRIYERSQ